MSQEMVLAFATKVKQDPALQAKLRPLAEDDMTGLLKIAAEAGFAFSAEDYMAFMQAQSIAPASDLSDNDLDVIAGGGINLNTVRCSETLFCVTLTCTMQCQKY